MKARLVIAIGLLAAPSISLAQSQPDSKRSPAVQALSYYIGSWKGHGHTGTGVRGGTDNLSSHMTCDWFTGGSQVLCRGEEKGPTGKREFLNIISYDQSTKSYTQYSISSFGESEYDKGGVFDGRKLTYLLNQDVDGKPAKVRFTEEHLSPNLMTYRAELSVEGQPWSVMGQGDIAKDK